MKLNKLVMIPLALASTAVLAEDVNYGDPTASFSTVGVSRQKDATQVNMMAGFGKHIFQLDVTAQDKDASGDAKFEDRANLRGRYFYVSDGLGASVDVLADSASQTVLGGAMYKIGVSDNLMVFPMVSLGRTEFKDDKALNTNLGQVGVYAMYAFNSGHWLYANPKTTYMQEFSENLNQVELGGGFMVAPNVSVGFKVEHNLKNEALAVQLGNDAFTKDQTTYWLNANYYF